MASTVARNSYKHAFLVSECNNLFLKLPPGEYTFHDMGLKVNVNDYEGKSDQVTNLNKDVQISGLSTDPIDYWSDNKLEKLFSKLSFLLMRLYEMDTAKR
jgi:hypothetical protein